MAVAEDYDSLLGLANVGVGIGFFALAIFSRPVFGTTCFALAAALGQGYYHKKYGKVKRERSRVWLEVAAVLAIAAVVGPALIVDNYLPLAILVAPLCAGVGLWVFFRVAYPNVGATGWHYGALALLVLSSFVPLTGLITTSSYLTTDFAALGVAFVIVGIVDHIRLTRAMGSSNVAH